VVLSAESFGANFNAYMQKCAGHPSMWLARAMNLRDFFQNAVLKKVEPRLPATMRARGNVAAYWWQSQGGLAAWVINHEYSERETVRLELHVPGDQARVEVYFGKTVCEARMADRLVMDVDVAPASMAVVIVKTA
jgi:hypothetical protein